MNCDCGNDCNFVPIGIMNCGQNNGGGGGIDYSPEEQDTGLKWIDGRKIYQKTVPMVHPSERYVWKMTTHGVANLDFGVGHEVFTLFARGSEMTYTPAPSRDVWPDISQEHGMKFVIERTACGLITNMNYSDLNDRQAFATIRYVCTDR